MASRLGRVHGPNLTGGRRAALPLKGRHPADVAELVDALDLGSSAARRAGSSPAVRTILRCAQRSEGCPPKPWRSRSVSRLVQLRMAYAVSPQARAVDSAGAGCHKPAFPEFAPTAKDLQRRRVCRKPV